MRILLTLFACFIFFASTAQTHLFPGTAWGYAPWQPFVPYSQFIPGTPNRSWQLQPFTSASVGYTFLGGGGVSYLSAPVGVILFHPLNNNFTAFGAASIAPTIFHFNSLYTTPAGYPGNGVTGLNVNASVTGGVIYTNEAKTFSISGSISVGRGSNPVYIPPSTNTRKQY
jgi:hypothetical protein